MDAYTILVTATLEPPTTKTNRVLMQGRRDLQTGLYTLDILATSIHPKRMTEIPFLECFCANNANKCKSKQGQVVKKLF